jgi:hypothetical protein
MYTEKELKENWATIKFKPSFEPTLNPFKNGLLVNYKKVGTRYIKKLLSLPLITSSDKIQMDMIITRYPRSKDGYLLDSFDYIINYEHVKKFCYTEFEMKDAKFENRYHSNYRKSIEFLNYCEVSNYTELFFNNKKDIVFLIRNPIYRFFSGVIHVLYTILHDIDTNKELVEEINFYTKLDIDDLKNLYKLISNYWDMNDEKLFTLKKNELDLLISYIIEKQWNVLFRNIHTQNYLFNYVEWIYNIKDKSKIKIIDLDDCRSNKSLEFFTSLVGSNILKSYHSVNIKKTYWEWVGDQTRTNKPIYNIFYEKFINSNFNLDQSSMYYYLKDEYELYDSLINSPYFVDLKQNFTII